MLSYEIWLWLVASGIDGIFYRLPDPFCKRERQVASRPAAGSAPVAGWLVHLVVGLFGWWLVARAVGEAGTL